MQLVRHTEARQYVENWSIERVRKMRVEGLAAKSVTVSFHSIACMAEGRGSGHGLAWDLFSEAVQHLVEGWAIMHAAVREEFGGAQSAEKYEKFVDDLLRNLRELWSGRKELNWESIYAFGEEVIATDFNVAYDEDDAELEAMARRIEDVYRQCMRGDLADAAYLSFLEFEDMSSAVGAGLVTDAMRAARAEAHAARAARDISVVVEAHDEGGAGDDDGDDSEDDGAAAGGGGGAKHGDDGSAAGVGAHAPKPDAHGASGVAEVEDDGWVTVPVKKST
jgi:hypothetical protein